MRKKVLPVDNGAVPGNCRNSRAPNGPQSTHKMTVPEVPMWKGR